MEHRAYESRAFVSRKVHRECCCALNMVHNLRAPALCPKILPAIGRECHVEFTDPGFAFGKGDILEPFCWIHEAPGHWCWL